MEDGSHSEWRLDILLVFFSQYCFITFSFILWVLYSFFYPFIFRNRVYISTTAPILHEYVKNKEYHKGRYSAKIPK